MTQPDKIREIFKRLLQRRWESRCVSKTEFGEIKGIQYDPKIYEQELVQVRQSLRDEVLKALPKEKEIIGSIGEYREGLIIGFNDCLSDTKSALEKLIVGGE